MVRKTPIPHVIRVVLAGFSDKATLRERESKSKETSATAEMVYLPNLGTDNTTWHGGVRRIICAPADQREWFEYDGLEDELLLRPPNRVLGAISNQRAWLEGWLLSRLQKTHGIAIVSDCDLKGVYADHMISATPTVQPMRHPKEIGAVLNTYLHKFDLRKFTFAGIHTGSPNPNAYRGDWRQTEVSVGAPIAHTLRQIVMFNEHTRGHYPQDQNFLEDVYRGCAEHAGGGKIARFGWRFQFAASNSREDYIEKPEWQAARRKLDTEFPWNKFGGRTDIHAGARKRKP